MDDSIGLHGAPISERPIVLFDFDGTLADTQPVIARTVGAVLAHHGYELTDAQMASLIGPSLEEGIRMVVDVDDFQARQIAVEYRELFDRTVSPIDIPLFPGALRLLDALAAVGRRAAVATSRAEPSAIGLVKGLGLTQLEATVGRVPGVRETKADSIAGALDALGAQPCDAVMVGDRMYDVLGAAELGMPCIGIYSGAAVPGELEGARAAAICLDLAGVAEVLGVGWDVRPR